MFYGDAKLRRCTMTYMSLWCVWPNHVSRDHEQMNVLLCQCSSRHLTEDTYIFYCDQWHKTAIKALLPSIFIVWKVTYISVTHRECSVASPLNNSYANATQWYVLCTLPILQYYTSIFVYICQVFSPVQVYQPNFKKEHGSLQINT
jgi:hypothetical protein